MSDQAKKNELPKNFSEETRKKVADRILPRAKTGIRAGRVQGKKGG